MTERAAHLVDVMLPWVPVRRWVLTVPYRLRYQLASIEPIIDRVFEGLAAARHAFAYLLSGRHLGKVVIRVAA